ncbi:MAG: ABC transporter permease [Candidatus Bipolaricaulia bacterium]
MSGLGKYIITRLAVTVPMILVLLTFVFFLLRIMPGDPVLAMLGGRNISPELIEAYRVRLGLNRPLYAQYIEYLGKIVHGDFGESTRTNKKVLEDILLRFPATLELAIFGMLIAILIGLWSGTYAAIHSDRLSDHAIRIFNIGSFAIPVFWIGLVLQLVFGVWLRWFPVAGRLSPQIAASFQPITRFYTLDCLILKDLNLLVDVLKHLAMPAFTLGLVLSGLIGRISRSSMLEVIDKEYVTTARSKGLTEPKVNYKHALRNALIPIVTVMGLQFAILMGGAILTETTFSWPGLARYLVQSVDSRDYMAIQGAVVWIAILISSVSLIVDIIYSFLDPRVRY